MPVLEVQNVSVSRGKFSLSKINFSVNMGETLIILGDNGSGKTTLLDAIAGFLKINSGRIMINGRNVANLSPSERGVGYVFQTLALFPHMNVTENILYGTHFHKFMDVKDRLNRITNLLEINNILGRRINTLSGGEKQKVALARTLILQPNVLLMDEPTAALSPQEKLRVMDELKAVFKSLSQTVIFVTHNVSEAYRMGGRIAVMGGGKILQIGNAGEIVYHPVSHDVASIFGEINKFTVMVEKCASGICSAELGCGKVFFLGNFDAGESVLLFIRPEDVLLKNTSVKTSARNNFSGIVKNVSFAGPLVYVDIELAGEGNEQKFLVLISKQSFEELAVEVGKSVFLSFKITAIHPVKLSE